MTPPLRPVTSPTGATVSRGATDAPADAWRTPTGPVIDALHETARLQREARERSQAEEWADAHVIEAADIAAKAMRGWNGDAEVLVDRIKAETGDERLSYMAMLIARYAIARKLGVTPAFYPGDEGDRP